MLSWLYNALGTVLHWFSSWTGSYALALLFYALIFKILFLPFAIKQQKNQIAMAKLAPKIYLSRAKYKGRTDQHSMRRQQEEIMELQQKEGYSMLSGCLPLLLQIPIIFWLYAVIRNPLSYIAKFGEEPIELIYAKLNGAEKAFADIDQIALAGQIRGAGSLYSGFFEDIAEKHSVNFANVPDFTLWGVDLSLTPSFTAFSLLLLIPVLAAGFQWFTMFLSRKLSGNANQLQPQGQDVGMSLKLMDLIMPLMTIFLTFSFSGMLGLYWIYQSIITIAQMLILAKFMPIPKYTEEEIKQMKKAQRAAEKAQKAIIKTQPKYRSLHYIDEDDYEELPTVKTNNGSQSGNNGQPQNKPEIKD